MYLVVVVVVVVVVAVVVAAVAVAVAAAAVVVVIAAATASQLLSRHILQEFSSLRAVHDSMCLVLQKTQCDMVHEAVHIGCRSIWLARFNVQCI